MKKFFSEEMIFNRLAFKQLLNSEKLAVAVSSIVLAVFALLICIKFAPTQSYPDFIVGNTAWYAGSKTQDLIAAPIFFVVLFFGFLVISTQLVKHKIQFGEYYSFSLSNYLIWWSLLFLFAISGIILGSNEELLLISATGILFIIVSSIFQTPKEININSDVIGLSIFSIILVALFPIEIALILGRAPIALVGEINLYTYQNVTYVMFGFGAFAGLLYVTRYPEKITANLPRLLLISQVGLATLFLTLYPARLLQPSGVVSKYETTIWLKVLVIGMIAWGIYDVIRRYRKYSTTTFLNKLLSPIALFALLVGLKYGNTIAPIISPDDYHFGEQLLGWWSYFNGTIPYLEFMPAHGLMTDDYVGFLANIFYDGSAGSIGDAKRVSIAMLAFAAFLSIYLFSGSIGLAFLIILFLGNWITLLFLMLFICLFFSQSLMESPSRWLSVWFIMIPVIILGIPPQGLLLVLATGVMAAYFAWSLLRYPDKKALTSVLASLIALLFIVFLTPLSAILFAAIRYVVENGKFNQVAYGIQWALSWNGKDSVDIVFEFTRMSWIIIPIFSLTIIFLSERDNIEKRNAFYQALVALSFMVLIIPYSMGRIDPEVISRSGMVSLFGLCFLLPILAWKITSQNNRIAIIFLITCIGITFHLYRPQSLSNLVSSASSSVPTPLLKDGSEIGLSNIGKAYLEDAHLDRLMRLNALLSEKLDPGETYLDLTSRNAQYFYLNRRPIIAVTAPYNMPTVSQQKRAVEAILKKMPRVALLAGENIVHDGGGLALRNPYLYRFIFENYTPRSENGFIVGYIKNQGEHEHYPGRTNSLFQQAFSPQDLQKIPIAWGRSEESLGKKMTLIKMIDEVPVRFNQIVAENNGYKINGIDPGLVFDISHLEISGLGSGLLKLDFSCIKNRAEPNIQLFWWGDDDQGPSEESSLRFSAENGVLIVPVDSSPYWLTLKRVKAIRIDIDNFSECRDFAINNIGLFQRNF